MRKCYKWVSKDTLGLNKLEKYHAGLCEVDDRMSKTKSVCLVYLVCLVGLV